MTMNFRDLLEKFNLNPANTKFLPDPLLNAFLDGLEYHMSIDDFASGLFFRGDEVFPRFIFSFKFPVAFELLMGNHITRTYLVDGFVVETYLAFEITYGVLFDSRWNTIIRIQTNSKLKPINTVLTIENGFALYSTFIEKTAIRKLTPREQKNWAFYKAFKELNGDRIWVEDYRYL